ncbi:MAG TPA: hypothetical protein DIC53_05425 [Synergistaceae bacterium]|jgi:hypothetical protein|nr:hypothetical protein [Synergistaceae bacterium]
MRHSRRTGRWLILLTVLTLAVLACSAGASALDLPEADDPFRLTIPEGTEYEKPFGAIYGFPDVRLWGWSKDGKAALSVVHEVAGRGGFEIYYVIQDMVSDKVLWTLDDDTYNWENEGADVEGFDSDRIAALSYKRNRAAVDGALQQYAIQGETNPFLAFPMEWNEWTYTPDISIVEEKEPQFYDDIASYTVSLARSGGKTKKIAFVDDTASKNVYVCAHTLSPFEDRVLVVIAEERFVFEGTELFYSFVGCDLKKGF